MRLRGWIWAFALAGMTIFSVWRLAGGQAIQTDLMAMLPDMEKNPVGVFASTVLSFIALAPKKATS